MRKESEDDVAQIRAQRAARRSALSAPTSNGILTCIQCQALLMSNAQGMCILPVQITGMMIIHLIFSLP